TGLLLYLILKREIGQLEASKQSLEESNQRLISIRKRLEAFQKIINASPMVVCLWKNAPSWPLTMISDNAPQLFGHSVDAFLSGKVPYAQIVHPDDLQRITQEIIAYIKSKKAHPIAQQYRIITAEGTIKWVEDRTLIRHNPEGRIEAFQGIVFDITDLKNEENKSRELLKQLLQAQKMESVGRLAGGVAHDFNNLLAVVIGYAELLLHDTDPTHPRHEGLSAILEAAHRARNLTRQLLAFGRKQMLDIQALDINGVITHFENLLRRMLGDDITLKLSLDDAPCLVRADVTQMEQILLNLAVNARDAMPGGGTLTIATEAVESAAAHAAAEPDTPAGPLVRITVRDTGIGIPREVIDYIFEPFFTTKDKEIGSGLGLSTVYGIVKQHGGHILVHSTPGNGATFTIHLPRAEAAVTTLSAPPPAAPVPQPPRTATVLVVEDDVGVRQMACTVLEKWGYTVLSAEDADNAIALARTHKGTIDLLLTDVIMPTMKGPEVYAHIADLQPGLKVLYMSGYTRNAIFKNDIGEAGAHFIQKPFSINALADQVAHVLSTEPSA
ncbi:MAG: response regulator, partial [Desulfatitalea sp.]|nr:response regulator [Desulfatitalea sp.]